MNSRAHVQRHCALAGPAVVAARRRLSVEADQVHRAGRARRHRRYPAAHVRGRSSPRRGNPATIVVENRPGGAGVIAMRGGRQGARRTATRMLMGNHAGLAMHAASRQEPALRSVQELRAGHPAGHGAEHPGGASVDPGEHRSRSSSPTPRPIPASSATPRRAPAPPATSPANCSSCTPASTSCTCPTRARRRPRRTWPPAMSA